MTKEKDTAQLASADTVGFDETLLEQVPEALKFFCETMGLRDDISPDSTINPLLGDDSSHSSGDSADLYGSDSVGRKRSRLEKLRDRFSFLPAVQITDHTSSQDAEDTDHPDEKLSQVEVLGILGQGGMGVVSLAEQHALHRKIAIKQVKPDHISKKTLNALFQEAKLTGVLEHPNIVPIYFLGRDDAQNPVILMRKVEGVTWQEMLKNPNHPRWEKVGEEPLLWNLHILMQICNAVEFAHTKGIIHRDIKPENVMIGEFGEVYLLDWGLGFRLAHRSKEASSDIVGTPAYMAPEMLQGNTQHLSERTDVYLLGATLHEVLTGHFKHLGTSLQNLIFSALESKPFTYDAEVPKELGDICNQATHVSPAERFADVLSFRKAIEGYIRHRESTRLEHIAEQKMLELKQGLKEAAQAEYNRMQKLYYECLFGFEQALQSWPDNPNITAFVEETKQVMCRYHIQQKRYFSAKAIFEELSKRKPSLKTALQELQAEHEAKELAAERLKAIEYEYDPSVSKKQRIYGAIFMTSLFLVGTILMLILTLTDSDRLELRKVVVLPIILFFAYVGVIYFKREVFLKTIFNRYMSFTVGILLGSICSHRVVGALLGYKLHQVLIVDMLFISSITAMAAVVIDRRFWIPSIICFFMSFVATQLPRHAMAMLALCAVFTLFCALIFRLMTYLREQESSSK